MNTGHFETSSDLHQDKQLSFLEQLSLGKITNKGMVKNHITITCGHVLILHGNNDKRRYLKFAGKLARC